MRFINEKGDVRIYAVAGTQTVLLSFDMDRKLLDNKGFLGFDVTRVDPAGNSRKLNGSKHFASLAKDADDAIRKTSFVQTFYWQDYTADPDMEYTYKIRCAFGTPAKPTFKYDSSIKVKTEPLHDGKHSVYFNYGVTGSQAFAKNPEFGNKKVDELNGKALKDALHFLGRELWEEGLLQFVRKAKDNTYTLYGSFYEFQYPPFLLEFKAAKNRGVDVQLVVSGKEEQYVDKVDGRTGKLKKKNQTCIREAGIASLIKAKRTKPNQPHNKFMILAKNGVPEEVWTGSTNITLPGIFGQCNTGHWIVDKTIAAQYLKYWKALIPDPTMGKLAVVSESIQQDTDLIALPKGDYVFFSPRDKGNTVKPAPLLQRYADLIDSASELVCMIFPFNMDDAFATVYGRNKDYIRLLIFESASDAEAVKSNDRDLMVTAGSVYQGKDKEWAKEVTAKFTTEAGILYVHNKFFIVDPLTDNPVVLTGSANFSGSSIRDNDENSILIKGNARVADIYLSEFDRLFTQFWPRYLAVLDKKKGKKPKAGFSNPLDETGTFHEVYYDQTKYRCKRKMLFVNMSGAKKY